MGRWRLGEGPLGRVTTPGWEDFKAEIREISWRNQCDRVDFLWEMSMKYHEMSQYVTDVHILISKHLHHSASIYHKEFTKRSGFLRGITKRGLKLPVLGQREPHDGVCGGHPHDQLLWRHP